MKTLYVVASEGLKVPREDNPREYITDQKLSTEVPASAYYLRRISQGELIELPGLADPDGTLVVGTSDETDATSPKTKKGALNGKS